VSSSAQVGFLTSGLTPLERNRKFWTTHACVLVAILRRRKLRIDVTQGANQLCEVLVEKIRATS
jgi:hypothetical protein